MDRLDDLEVRDSLRALLYMRILSKACNEAEACMARHLLHMGSDTTQAGAAVRGLERRWAAVLDDFVAPVVSHALHASNAEPFVEAVRSTQLYQQLFLNYDGKSLTPWARGLPRTHPFLYELMQKFLSNSVENLRLCLQRFQDDMPLITEFLGDAPGPIQHVQHTGSDGHCGGQGVLILYLSSAKLVYKPFGAEPAQLASNLFALMNKQPSLLEAQIPCVPVLVPPQEKSPTGNKYHWAAFISQFPCQIADDVATFYRKAGAVTAAASMLGFSDGHNENLLASGSSPYIIDTETFFQPSSSGLDDLQDVLNTGLIQLTPRIFSLADGDWIAGFQHPPEIPIASHSLAILEERTHLMSVVYDLEERQQQSQALPFLQSEPQLLKDYVPDFAQGFKLACQAFQELLTSGLAQDLASLSQQAASCVVRIVPRPTSLYVRLLRLLQQPNALTSREAAEAQLLEALRLQGDSFSKLWRSELDDLLDLDVPAFYICPSRPGIWFDSKGRIVETDIFASAWDPIKFVNGSSACNKSKLVPSICDIISKNPNTDFEANSDSMSDGAMSIANEVISKLFTPLPTSPPARHHALYSGLSGILVFLAGTQKLMPGHDIVTGACRRVYDAVISDRPMADMCGGGFQGPASDAYGIALAGILTSQSEWVQAAAEIYVSEITPSLIDADLVLDVVGGVSGCALVGIAICSALDRLQPGNDSLHGRVKEIVLRCGNHLVNQTVLTCKGLVPACNNPQLSKPQAPSRMGIVPGFAHGMAGIILALQRLYVLTGDETFHACAVQAAAAEDTLYDSSHNTWKPRLKDDEDAVAHGAAFAWCWGPPGIALGRLGCKGGNHGIAIPAPIEPAKLCAFNKARLELCCGTTGRLDVFLELGGSMASVEPSVLEILKEYHKEGSTIFQFDEPLGLMRGISGLGYALLRFKDPAQYPSVLSLNI